MRWFIHYILCYTWTHTCSKASTRHKHNGSHYTKLEADPNEYHHSHCISCSAQYLSTWQDAWRAVTFVQESYLTTGVMSC